MTDFSKKKVLVTYNHYPDYPTHTLQVIQEENWSGIPIVKCKVLTEDWYAEVYLTTADFNSGRAKLLTDKI